MTPGKLPSQRKKQPQRVILYPQDLVALTGKHPQTCRKMLNTVRTVLGKASYELVSIREFSEVFGVEEDLIREFIA